MGIDVDVSQNIEENKLKQTERRPVKCRGWKKTLADRLLHLMVNLIPNYLQPYLDNTHSRSMSIIIVTTTVTRIVVSYSKDRATDTR